MRKEKTWLSPLSIPEGTEGEYKIVHMKVPAGQGVMFNSSRNKIFGLQKGPDKLIYDVNTTWHTLQGPTGTWMTDLPVEQRQMEECLKGMKGTVLVGGLGLGLAASLLAKKRIVKEVLVVEKRKEVIDLVYRHLENRHKISIHHEDLFDFLQNWSHSGYPFDHAFYDIWQSDGEHTFFNTVVPLLQLSKDIVKTRSVNWNENVMRGQLLMSIFTRLTFLRPELESAIPKPTLWEEQQPIGDCYDPIYHNWSVPFFRWWKDRQPKEKELNRLAKLYCQLYGLPGWESKWKEAVHKKGS